MYDRGRLQLAQGTLATLCSNPLLATEALLHFVQVTASLHYLEDVRDCIFGQAH